MATEIGQVLLDAAKTTAEDNYMADKMSNGEKLSAPGQPLTSTDLRVLSVFVSFC